MNILDTDRPVMVAAMIMGSEGGMMGPMQLEAAVTATEKLLSYPRSTIMVIAYLCEVLCIIITWNEKEGK